MFISIITPFFNTGKYLQKCIQSVLNQTYTNFEFLLIDDGSTDNSFEIAYEFSKLDSRIQLYCQKNLGVSTARNIGLDYAKGEWVTFLDSDDYLQKKYLEEMLCELKKLQRVDFLIQNPIHLKPNAVSQLYTLTDTYMTVRDFYLAYQVSRFGHAHTKLYNLKIINDFNLRFNTQIFIAEDCLFMIAYLRNCRYVSLSNRSNYIYCQRPGSLITKLYDFEKESYLHAQLKKELLLVFQKHQLPKNLLVRELEYPFQRMICSNSKIKNRCQRLTNYQTILQQNKRELIYLITQSKKRLRVSQELHAGGDFPTVLDIVFRDFQVN